MSVQASVHGSSEKEAPSSLNSSRPSSELEITFSADEERQLLRKVDRKLIFPLTFLYLLSFLDRANVGNAKLYGMLTDIGVTDPSAYNTGLALYFLGYVLFEIPAMIILKKYDPSKWLPLLVVGWGITAACQAFVSTQTGFYVGRFFLGVSEAGLFCGCIFVFSMYYRRNERHWRVAIFFGGAAVAGAFGGVLAWAINHMEGVGGKHSYFWLFMLEGIFTILVGLSAFFWVPGYPRDATFLTPRDREILLARLAADSDAADLEPFAWKGVIDAFKDPLVLAYSFLFHGFAFPLYSLSLFLPTIIAQLGYSSLNAQLLTIPPYVAAFLSILFVAYGSAYSNKRGAWIVGSGAVAIVGYIILLTTGTPGARYAGIFIAVLGIYSGNALLLSWPSENVAPSTKRATAGGMQIFVGDIGAIAGVLVYRPSLNANFFRIPHIVAIIYTLFGMLVATYLFVYMGRENDRRAALRAAGDPSTEKEKMVINGVRVGDRHPSYIYQL